MTMPPESGAAAIAVSEGGPAALRSAYEGLASVVAGLGDDESWTATGCLGWTVRDLVHHCVEDARRGLIAAHTDAGADADARTSTDAVRYWTAWGNDEAAATDNRRATRLFASVYPAWAPLRGLYLETSAAAASAVAGLPPERTLATQGYAMTAAALASTLAVEAVLHHLDLVAQLPGAAKPAGEAAAHARSVVDLACDLGAGGRLPADWPDVSVLSVATGRSPVPVDAPQAVRSLDLPVFS